MRLDVLRGRRWPALLGALVLSSSVVSADDYQECVLGCYRGLAACSLGDRVFAGAAGGIAGSGVGAAVHVSSAVVLSSYGALGTIGGLGFSCAAPDLLGCLIGCDGVYDEPRETPCPTGSFCAVSCPRDYFPTGGSCGDGVDAGVCCVYGGPAVSPEVDPLVPPN